MRKVWTKSERWLLKQHYADTPTSELADFLECSERAVYMQAWNLGRLKTKEYRKQYCGLQPGHELGKTTQFKPGHCPHNKGIKGWDSGGNSAKTRFKKGQMPHNWVPVGSERFSKEGILQRKVSDTGYPPRDWKSVHALLWEDHHGPVPAGHLVVFKNGDRSDIHIDNLECITRAENMKRNTIHNLPEELVDVCRLRGVLNRHINKRIKQNEK